MQQTVEYEEYALQEGLSGKIIEFNTTGDVLVEWSNSVRRLLLKGNLKDARAQIVQAAAEETDSAAANRWQLPKLSDMPEASQEQRALFPRLMAAFSAHMDETGGLTKKLRSQLRPGTARPLQL